MVHLWPIWATANLQMPRHFQHHSDKRHPLHTHAKVHPQTGKEHSTNRIKNYSILFTVCVWVSCRMWKQEQAPSPLKTNQRLISTSTSSRCWHHSSSRFIISAVKSTNWQQTWSTWMSLTHRWLTDRAWTRPWTVAVYSRKQFVKTLKYVIWEKLCFPFQKERQVKLFTSYYGKLLCEPSLHAGR